MDEGEFSLQDQTTREQEDLTNRVLEIYGPFVKMTEASASCRPSAVLA